MEIVAPSLPWSASAGPPPRCGLVLGDRVIPLTGEARGGSSRCIETPILISEGKVRACPELVEGRGRSHGSTELTTNDRQGGFQKVPASHNQPINCPTARALLSCPRTRLRFAQEPVTKNGGEPGAPRTYQRRSPGIPEGRPELGPLGQREFGFLY